MGILVLLGLFFLAIFIGIFGPLPSQEELKAIQKEAAKKAAKAKERFKKELEKINKETRNEVKTVLTPKQKALLDKLDDR